MMGRTGFRISGCVVALAAFLLLGTAGRLAVGQASSAAQLEIEFTNEKLSPSHWTLKLDESGRGQFDAEAGTAVSEGRSTIRVENVHEAIQVSPAFAAQAFAVARRRSLFNFPCESHLKLAFQGTKRLAYAGPEGKGECVYNYSKDKEIQSLGDRLQSVVTTLLYGARLEKLLQHDRLGLDQEMENLTVAVQEGTAVQPVAIGETLRKIAADEQVLERARRKARLLLADTQ